MAYLIDTCVISELRKARCNRGVAEWMASIQPGEAYLSVLTLGEIRRGIELHRRQHATEAGALERWLGGLEAHYSERILPIDAAVAERWGRLSPTQPLPVSVGLIAATALEHKLTVVTRNIADFERSGVGNGGSTQPLTIPNSAPDPQLDFPSEKLEESEPTTKLKAGNPLCLQPLSRPFQ